MSIQNLRFDKSKTINLTDFLSKQKFEQNFNVNFSHSIRMLDFLLELLTNTYENQWKSQNLFMLMKTQDKCKLKFQY